MRLYNVEVLATNDLPEVNDAIIKTGHARMKVAKARLLLAQCDRELALAVARAEAEVIEAAVGEKTLGSNAETRRRSLALQIPGNSDLIKAQDFYDLAYLDHEEAKAILESLRNYLKLALVAGI